MTLWSMPPSPHPPNTPQAMKLRKLADAMEPQIKAKLDPGIAHQRVTARRAGIARQMAQDGERLQKIQFLLRALADLHERGMCPPLLATIKSRKVVEILLDNLDVTDSDSSWMADLTTTLGRAGITIPAFKHTRFALMQLLEQRPVESDKARQIRDAEFALIGRKIPGYFPTPRAVAERLIEEADMHPAMRVLEPSAGKGNIAEVIRELHPDALIDTVEVNLDLRAILNLKGFTVMAHNFLAYMPYERYDRIIMNPPFEDGQDIDHVRQAYKLLRRGGRIVSVMAPGFQYRQDRKAQAFREWLKLLGARVEKLPEGSFLSSENPTGVSTVMVTIDDVEGIEA